MKTYTVGGSTLSIADWARRAGISRQAMTRRVNNAKTPEELASRLTQKVQQGQRNDLGNKG